MPLSGFGIGSGLVAGVDFLAGAAVLTASLIADLEVLGRSRTDVFFATFNSACFVATFFAGALLALAVGFLVALAAGFLSVVAAFFAAATGFFTFWLVAALALFLTAVCLALGAAFLTPTFFLIPIFKLALIGWALDLDVLLLLTGISSSIYEVLASLSPRRPQCVQS